MTFLYVILGIFLFFALILSIRGRVVLEIDDEGELSLAVKALCFTFRIAPKKPKPIKIKDYTVKKHKKRLRKNYQSYLKKQEKKAQKEAEKKAKKEKKKQEKKDAKKEDEPKRSVLDWLDIATSVLKVLFGRFAKHLRIKIAKLRINVATGDAASTAILYGVVIQSVAYIIEILQSITNVDGLKKADIAVNTDYLSESTTVELKFVFSLRVWHLFSILFGTIGRALKKFLETSPEAKEKAEMKARANYYRRKRKRKPVKKASTPLPKNNAKN